MGFWWAK